MLKIMILNTISRFYKINITYVYKKWKFNCINKINNTTKKPQLK